MRRAPLDSSHWREELSDWNLLDIAIARCLLRQEARLDVGSQALDLGAVPSGHSCVLEVVKAVRPTCSALELTKASHWRICGAAGQCRPGNRPVMSNGLGNGKWE